MCNQHIAEYTELDLWKRGVAETTSQPDPRSSNRLVRNSRLFSLKITYSNISKSDIKCARSHGRRVVKTTQWAFGSSSRLPVEVCGRSCPARPRRAALDPCALASGDSGAKVGWLWKSSEISLRSAAHFCGRQCQWMTTAVYSAVGVFGVGRAALERLPAPLGADEESHWPNLESGGGIPPKRNTGSWRCPTKPVRVDESPKFSKEVWSKMRKNFDNLKLLWLWGHYRNIMSQEFI